MVARKAPVLTRLLWFVGLWLAGVAAVELAPAEPRALLPDRARAQQQRPAGPDPKTGYSTLPAAAAPPLPAGQEHAAPSGIGCSRRHTRLAVRQTTPSRLIERPRGGGPPNGRSSICRCGGGQPKGCS